MTKLYWSRRLHCFVRCVAAIGAAFSLHWSIPAAAQTGPGASGVEIAPKPVIRKTDRPVASTQAAAASEEAREWRNERFEQHGEWLLSCEVAVAERPAATPPPRRCYLQNAQAYSPRPDFRSATLFVLSTPDGYIVQLSLEPGADVAATDLAIRRATTGDAVMPALIEQLPDAPQEVERLFSLSECEGHLCDLGRVKSTFLLTRMYAVPTGALIWRMPPLNGDRPEIRIDLADFAAAAEAFAAADPDAARAYEAFIK